jgi:hypothetical protein
MEVPGQFFFMPERGWSILTVREDTAGRVKELAKWGLDDR